VSKEILEDLEKVESKCGNGDDALVGLETSSFGDNKDFIIKTLRMAVKEAAARCGLSVKLGISFELSKAEVLSCRFYKVRNGWAIGKKPGRLLTRLGWSIKNMVGVKNPPVYQRFLGTLKSIENMTNFVPYARVYVQACISWLEKRNVVLIEPDWYEGKILANGSYKSRFCADTWMEFQKFYGSGFNATDEERFRKKVERSLMVHGLPCLIEDDSIEALTRLDAELESEF
jgi:hypothetical protein